MIKMDEISAYYKSVTVEFPEWYAKPFAFPFKKEAGAISGDNVTFTRGKTRFVVKIWPHSIPRQFSDNTAIQDLIVRPAIEMVLADMNTINDLVPKFRRLARAEKMQAQLFYERETISGDWYRVFDYSLSPKALGDRHSFEALLPLKSQNPDKVAKLIMPEHRSLFELVQHVDKEEDHIAYVKGKTLREAAERALQIYRLAPRLARMRV